MMSMTDDASSEIRSPPSWGWLSLWSFLVLILLYVLSTGPVIRAVNRAGVQPDVLGFIYAPLIFLSDHVPMVQELFEWYVEDIWAAH